MEGLPCIVGSWTPLRGLSDENFERPGGCLQRTKLIPLGVTDLHLCSRSEVFALHESNPRDAGLTWKSEKQGVGMAEEYVGCRRSCLCRGEVDECSGCL